jgi:hypothetical protein
MQPIKCLFFVLKSITTCVTFSKPFSLDRVILKEKSSKEVHVFFLSVYVRMMAYVFFLNYFYNNSGLSAHTYGNFNNLYLGCSINIFICKFFCLI